ncbi:hypothetical protein WMZ97_12100 [Lentibacillus sp. N15]|uniref:hypothetical protein n=1 Tax=Lentibacillus songyuanensis TaxID=3136161 RepID=UPI0031BAE097
MRPNRAGTDPNRAGIRPNRAGTNPNRAGTGPNRAGTNPKRAGIRPNRAGADPYRAGTNPNRAGIRPNRAGTGPKTCERRPVSCASKYEMCGMRVYFIFQQPPSDEAVSQFIMSNQREVILSLRRAVTSFGLGTTMVIINVSVAICTKPADESWVFFNKQPILPLKPLYYPNPRRTKQCQKEHI